MRDLLQPAPLDHAEGWTAYLLVRVLSAAGGPREGDPSVTTITPTSHPRIWAVCLAILHDNGAINRIDPVPTSITLPGQAVDLSLAEGVLVKLTEEERAIFATGEAVDAGIVSMRYGLAVLHNTLNKWFVRGMQRRWTT